MAEITERRTLEASIGECAQNRSLPLAPASIDRHRDAVFVYRHMKGFLRNNQNLNLANLHFRRDRGHPCFGWGFAGAACR